MPSFSNFILSLFTVSLLVCQGAAFGVTRPSLQQGSLTQLHFFGGLKDAFSNDDKLGKPKDAGISGGPKFNEQVTVNGKPVAGSVAGQLLTVVAGKARVKIPVNCQKGDCGTCMVKINGRTVKGKCRACTQAFRNVGFFASCTCIYTVNTH
jgi:ferredoxin